MLRTPPFRSRALVVALLGTLLAPAVAPLAAQPTDTSKTISREPLFTSRDAWIAGGFTLATIAMCPIDRWAARELQDSTVQANRFFHHTATNVRLVTEKSWWIGGALYAAGKLTGKRDIADLGLHGTEAILVGIGVVDVGKVLAGRNRPYVNIDKPHDFSFGRGWNHEESRSFPSGHTVTAFSAAAAVTAEAARHWPEGNARWLVGIPLYGGAALTGLSRMYNSKHWASDVAMGAAIGTFSGLKVVRYHHSHPGNRIDKWLLGASIAPNGNGGYGLAFTLMP